MINVVLLGVQWAWKWTQAKLILEKYGNNYAYFEAWQILRALMSNNNSIWNYFKDIINAGNLVDPSVITALLDVFFITVWKRSFLIDGYPRNTIQYCLFNDRMKKIWKDYIVLYLDLPEGEAIRRLTSRRICKKCWNIQSILVDGRLECKKCGWDLVQREDDKEEVIKRRLEVYKKETLPIIEEFEKNWLLYRIDASGSIEEVFEEIEKVIGEWKVD